MIEGSGSIPLTRGSEDPDPGGPKTYGSDGSGFGSAPLLLSYAVSYWVTLHSEQSCNLLSLDAPFWAMLRCITLSYAALYWAKRHPTKLHSTLLSNAAPSWAMLLRSTGLSCTIVTNTAAYYEAALHPCELCCVLLIYAAPLWPTLNRYPQELRCLYLAELHTSMSYDAPSWA
jgi:hypothetical protein